MTDDVYAKLREQIVRVERHPGDVIYESELAAEFKVSKTPIREALRLLAHTGWVVVLPRKGYIVRPVELRDVRDVFEIRRMIEPALAGEAARIATPDQLAELGELVKRQSESGVADALIAAREFHLGLAAISGSHRVHALLEGLVDEVRRLHYLLPNVEGHITSEQELRAHSQILKALEDRDTEAARTLTVEHLNEVAHTLVRGFAGV
ncbi:MAG TPA: GntR family transcriptional regulator [Kribbella sp.]|jgi:DNA-binding GntR family transcriptional regulator